jgi:hypothetical protein
VRNGFAGAITRALAAGAGDNGYVSVEPIMKFVGFRDRSSPGCMTNALAVYAAIVLVNWCSNKL